MTMKLDLPHPPIIFDLTPDQADYILAHKPVDKHCMIVGYARRRPFPEQEAMTLCAWFAPYDMAVATLATNTKKTARKRTTKEKDTE